MGDMMDKGIISMLLKAVVGTTVASIYMGTALYFKDNFQPNTSIGGIDIGGKSAEVAKQVIEAKGDSYTISLYGKGVDKQKLSGKDFELNYSVKEDLKDYQKEQNALAWPISLVKKSELDVKEDVDFNEALLEQAIEELDYFKETKVIQPVDAKLNFNGENYEIIPEVEGNKLNKEIVKEKVIEAFKNNKHVIDLQEENCYEIPKVRADSKEIVEARDLLNGYMKSGITYLFGEKEEIVKKEQMVEWFDNGLDDDGKLGINEDKVREYVQTLDEKYSTLGRTRQFLDSYGQLSTVSGGDYGYEISVTKETEAIINALKSGESIRRKPIETAHSQGYRENEISTSYVEINLTSQYLWYYKDGKLITEGGVVTGDQSRRRTTPQGVYKLDYKQRNATLRGPGYATPVSFWMPFNGGIGIHDATWRGSFGGSIYKYNGSHGCVNTPYSMAQAIFNSIDESMPIVCYY